MPRKNARKVYENLPFPVSKYHKSHQKSSWKSYGIIFDEIGHTFEWWYVQYVYATHCSCCKIKFKNSLNRKIEHNHSITDAFNVRGVVCACVIHEQKMLKYQEQIHLVKNILFLIKFVKNGLFVLDANIVNLINNMKH